MNKGLIYAIIAYFLWGIFPVFWKALQNVPAKEILCHRMVWSFVFVLLILINKRHWKWLKLIKTNFKIALIFFGTASLLAINWFVYVWSVNHGLIVETSLGYFINPLLSVILGFIFLKERPRFFQWIAIIIAAGGIFYLTFSYGIFPWIALTLASTFGFYGLLRKTAPLNALEGLSLETAILFFPAAFYLINLEIFRTGSFGHGIPQTTFLLAFSGVATGLPLLFFSAAARKITLINLGFLQYIAPSLQFLLGVFVYHEIVSRTRLTGFIIVWIALLIYTVESIRHARRRNRNKLSI